MKPLEIGITALTVLLVALILLLPVETVILFLSDDAYYYTKVAMNHVAGLGLTFDGINPTNGFHPLWMLVIHPIYWLQLDVTASLRLVLIVQLLLYFCSLRIILMIGKRHFPDANITAAVATLLFFVPVTVLGLNGLESTLLVFVELLLVATLLKFCTDSDLASNRLLIGILLGLLFLSRLDTAFMILALAIAILVFEWQRHKSIVTIISRWWLAATVSVLIVAPYMAWNLITFDHLTPISGVLKNTFPYPHIRLGFVPRVLHFVAAILVVAAWFGYRLYTLPDQRIRYGLLLALTLGSLIHLLWSIVFMAWGTFQWHFVAQAPLIVVAVLDMSVLIAYRRSVATVALSVALLMNVGSLGLRLGHHQERLEAAAWLNARDGDNFRVGLRDAGVFGYFSERQVVNLDGLINSYEFVDAINSGQITAFLDGANVQYIADAYTPCDYETHQVNVVAHSSEDPRKVVGEIRIFQKRDELASFRTKKPFENIRLGNTCFVIWEGIGTPYPLTAIPGRR